MSGWSFDEPTRERLRRFLEGAGIAPGPLEIAPIGDGHSNLTFRVGVASGALVLRRPPPPPLPPGANDVLREATFLESVRAPGVPVPAVLARGEAGAVFDVPFYAMSLVDGLVLTDRLDPALDGPGAAGEMARALIDLMAALHAVDWRATPLAARARPEDFNARHLRIFLRMLDDGQGGVIAPFADIAGWLTAHVPPPSDACVIHNDLRLGNVMWARRGPPRVVSLLDWELATVGDPLLDLAYLVASIPRDGGTHTPIQDLSAALLAPSLPTADALIAQYFAATGRAPEDLSWYRAMVNFKLAALYRHSRLAGHDPYFADPAHEARFLAEAGRAVG